MVSNAASLGSAVLSLETDDTKLAQGLKQGEQATKQWASKAVLAIAGVGTAMVGVGVGLFKIGESFDASFDAIRIGTGATGDALEGLKADFRAVATAVPASFGEVGQVIADVNTRTGLTGKSLQDLSATILELSRITKTDVNANVAAATRLFGDWSVATEDQSATLDKVFRASQATGIGVDALMGKVVQFGAPLRQMGFSLEESMAMLGKWEKEGVNAELVLGSLRIAAGKFAKEGIDLKQGFADTVKSIAGMKNESGALGLAMEVFGARAGPDMAAAIREGRFAIDDYVKAIEEGGDTIIGLGQETADFGEKWQRFTNRALIAIEPLATRVFDFGGVLLDRVAPAIEGVLGAIEPLIGAVGERLSGAIGHVTERLEGLATVFRVLFAGDYEGAIDEFFLLFQGHLEGLGIDVAALSQGTMDFANSLIEGFARIRKAVAPVIERIAALIGGNLQAVLIGVAAAIASIVVPAFLGLAATVASAIGAAVVALGAVLAPILAVGAAVALLYVAWQNNFLGIRDIVQRVLEIVVPFIQAQMGYVIGWVQEHWPMIQQTVENVMNAIQAVIAFVLDTVTAFWEGHGERLMSIVGSVWTIIQTVIETAIRNVLDVLKIVMQIITGDWEGAWETIEGILSRTWEAIKTIVGAALNILGNLLAIAWDGIKLVAKLAWEAIGTGIRGVWDGIVGYIKGKINEIIDAINGLLQGWNSLSFSVPGFEVGLPSVDVPGVGRVGGGTLGWGGIDIQTPDLPLLPRLHQGGIVPGRPGEEVLALLEAGEEVRPRDQQREPLIGSFTYVANRRTEGEDDVRDVLESLTFRVRFGLGVP